MQRRGVIEGYSHDVSGGIIRTRDGGSYFFERRSWKCPDIPSAGDTVVFGATKEGLVVQVFKSDEKKISSVVDLKLIRHQASNQGRTKQ